MNNEVELNEELPPFPKQKYAGFWIRFGANLIDNIIVSVPLNLLNVALFFMLSATNMGYFEYQSSEAFDVLYDGVSGSISLLTWVLYYGLLTAGKHQATIGKRIFGLKVVGEQGQPISVGRAIGRYFAYIPSSLLFGLGFIAIGWSNKKQGWHDHLCKTYVVHN